MGQHSSLRRACPLASMQHGGVGLAQRRSLERVTPSPIVGSSAVPRPESATALALETRWRAALLEVQEELALERAARLEAELVLADTTSAFSALREQTARTATAAAAAVLAGGVPPVRPHARLAHAAV